MGSSDSDQESTERDPTTGIPWTGDLDSLPEISIEPAYSVYDRLRHIHEAPLKNLRRSLWWIRKLLHAASKRDPGIPRRSDQTRDGAAVRADLVRTRLGALLPLPRGVLNLRRVEYVEDNRFDWWYVHIRGYNHDDGGIELTAHYETEPSEHPDAHIELHGLDIEYGMAAVWDVL